MSDMLLFSIVLMCIAAVWLLGAVLVALVWRVQFTRATESHTFAWRARLAEWHRKQNRSKRE